MSNNHPIKPGVRVISRADLATLWNVSPNTIDVMRQRGHLRTVATGLFDLDHAQAFRAGQDPSRGLMSKQVNPRGVTPGTKAAEADAEAGDGEDGDTTADAKAAANILRARASRMASEAKMSVLTLRKAQGELLDKGDVKPAALEAAVVLRANLQNLGRRYGPQLAMRPAAECEAVIDRALFDLCEEFLHRMNDVVPEGVGVRIEEFWARKPSGVPEAGRR